MKNFERSTTLWATLLFFSFSSQTAFSQSTDTPAGGGLGFYITPLSGLVTTEAGGTDSFQVELTTQPTADVTLPLESSDPTEGTLDIPSLVFTSSDWSVPQVVTVTGQNDAEGDGHRAYTIMTGPAASADLDYDQLDPIDVSLTNQDDEDFQNAALEALYTATDGDNWIDNSNWLVGDPCTNSWYGVSCEENGNVIEIGLLYNNLTGVIPPELGSLVNLQYLLLYGNQLTGAIPTELGSLINLQELNLESNQLIGSPPTELGNLVNLQTLHLGSNQLTGGLPVELGNLVNLQVLDLGNNQLTGALPTELGNSVNLQSLFLHNNQLTGSLPTELGNLVNLQYLTLDNNQLTGSLPTELGNLVNLRYLFLYNNQLTGSLPTELGNLVNLQFLYLHNNQLTGSLPTELGNLVNLLELNLGNNQLTGSLPTQLGNLVNLLELNLGNNQLTGSLPTQLGNLVNLQTLHLGSNQLTGPLPMEMGNLVNLQYLYLYNNHLAGSLPTDLGNLGNLQTLHLGSNQLTGSLPSELANLTNLQELTLVSNQLTGSLPTELGNLANLQYLFLSSNQLTGSLPTELGNLINLTSLILAGNDFSGEVPTELGNLVNLQSLWIDYNRLYTADAGLDAFLDSKQGSDWSATQTMAPLNVQVTGVDAHSTTLTWDPIEYTGDTGRYRVLFSTSPGGPYSNGGATTNKSASGLVAQGLPANSTLYFVVQTETDSHGNNQNDLISELSAEVSDTTLVAPPGFFITPTSGLVTTETGGTDSFQLVLDTQPTANVTLPLESSDPTEGTLSIPNLVFTSSDWNVPQMVTVTGQDDAEGDGHRAYTIMTGPSASADFDYDQLDPVDVSLTNLDDEDFQKEALEALYIATDGDNWTDNSNWLVGDPCTNGWVGISCDQDGNVVEISLSSNNLAGNLPAQIGNLSYLEWLGLPYNELTGPIPIEIGNLINLRGLHLWANQMTGTVPAEIGNLLALNYLDIGVNQFEGPIPTTLGSLTGLTTLWLSDAGLSGSIPVELENLVNLQQLGLANNELIGPIPAGFASFNSISTMRLDDNQLSGSFPSEFGDLTNLQILTVSRNLLEGTIPAELGNLINLQELSLAGNDFSGEVPTELGNLVNLQSLWIDYNRLYTPDVGLDTFLDSKQGSDWSATQTVAPLNVQVTSVAAHSATLAWDPIEYTGNTGRYRVLFSTSPGGPYSNGGVTTNKSTGGLVAQGLPADSTIYFVVQAETDSHGTNPNDLTSLLSAEVSDTTLVAPPGFFITPTSGLVTTEAGGTDSFQLVLDTQPTANVTLPLESSDPTEGTPDIPSLVFTSSDWNVPQVVTVTGQDDAEGDGHRAYTIVTGPSASTDLDYDQLDPIDVSLINEDDEDFQTSALEALYAATDGDNWSDNSNWLVGDPCTNSWYGVSCSQNGNVVEIWLPDNNLTGVIPPDLGSLASLLYLHLGGNQLTGSLPTELGNLVNLLGLFIYDNQLTGSLSTDLGNLVNLQTLHLGNNQLTGSLPTELGNLLNLQYLGLYDNQLTGTLPTDLGSLTNLQTLNLGRNNLTGSLPTELGNLVNLLGLYIYENQLNGPLPDTLGSLASLETLFLSYNQFSGPVLPELGDLSNLTTLILAGNDFSGEVPTELGNLVNLQSLWIDYNRLYTPDAGLDAFLDSKQGGDWSATQTVAPLNVQVAGVAADSATLTWDPIEYTGDTGRYRVLYGTTEGGPWPNEAATSDKLTNGATVESLAAGLYYFVVQTETDPHGNNANALASEPSAEVSALISGSPGVAIDSFDVTANSVEVGGSLTLSWTTSNATECFAVDGVDGWSAESIELPSGDATLTLSTTGVHTFTLECTDGDNIVSAMQMVTVLDDDETLLISNFSVSPESISAGQPTTISWQVSNALSCEALSGPTGWQGLEITLPSGNAILPVAAPGCYTLLLECTDGVDTVSEAAILEVIPEGVIFSSGFEPPCLQPEGL